MRLKYIVNAMLVLSPLLLAGCGGSSSSSSSSSASSVENSEINLMPSLGKISLATARLYQSDGTTLLGTSEIGEDGVIPVSYTSDYVGPIIAVVLGDEDAQYFDEASGVLKRFGSGNVLRAVVPSGTTETAVTALTEAAYQLALANDIPLTDSTINLINDKVRLAMAPELESIITPPILFDSSTTSGDLDNSDAGKYALRLAAISLLGSADATPGLSIANQIALDLSDGSLDGSSDSGVINDLLYNVGTISEDIATHLTTMVANYGSESLQALVSSYSNISTSINLDGLISNESNSLPEAVSGQTIAMEYCCSGSNSPYINGEQIAFSFSGSGALQLDDQAEDIASTFTMRGSEYIWVDAENSVEYALSLFEGLIHEVNVQGVGGTPFYGQFSPIEEEVVDLTPDGDGAALSSSNGATGTVGSTTYTYTSTEDTLYAFVPTNSTGVFYAHDVESVDALTRWAIAGFPAAEGSYVCGEGGELPLVSLTLNGIPYVAENCTIEVVSASLTEVEGRFAANLVTPSGSAFGSVTNGYFRYEEPSSGSTSLADDEYGYTMTVDGENVTVTDVLALDGFDRPVANYLSLGDAPALQLRMIPDGGEGAYTCGEGPAFRKVELWYLHQGVYYYSENDGSSCSIEVTSADSTYEGTFSGTLYSNAGTKLVITDGFFRNDASDL